MECACECCESVANQIFNSEFKDVFLYSLCGFVLVIFVFTIGVAIFDFINS